MDISEIIEQLDRHGFEDTDEAEKLIAINDALWDIESREPWPFLEKTIDLNFAGSSATPSNVPADFKHVLYVVDNTTGATLSPERLETVRNRYGGDIANSDIPFLYYFVGSTIKFYPVPAASTGRFTMDYIATQDEVTAATLEAAILLPKRHHKLLTMGALVQLYNQEDDPELAAVQEKKFENRLQTVRDDLMRRQYQRADRIFVIDEDDDYIDLHY